MKRASLNEGCSILANMVRQLRPLYLQETTTLGQRAFMETVVGAAIFYLPKVPGLWTGHISVEAVKLHHPESGTVKPRLTADHEYPRKVAGADLLTMDWDSLPDPVGALESLYRNRYGRFTYISPQENRRLVKFQRADAFANAHDAYLQAGIILKRISKANLKRVKARDPRTIDEVIRRTDHQSDPQALVSESPSTEEKHSLGAPGPPPDTRSKAGLPLSAREGSRANDRSGELYQRLREKSLRLIPRGEHQLQEIYRLVKSAYPSLCQEFPLCSEVCKEGNQEPEWHHRVRSVLQVLKSPKGPVSKGARHGYWRFV